MKSRNPNKADKNRWILLLVLVAALFVILSKAYDDATLKWAYGIVGMVLGLLKR